MLFTPFMLFACFIIIILAIALPSLRISSLFRIVAIVLLYTAALYLGVVYIQSIGSGINIFSGLFHVTFTIWGVPEWLSQYLNGNFPLEVLLLSSLMPVKPAGGLPNKLVLTDELKQILIGLLLGDVFAFLCSFLVEAGRGLRPPLQPKTDLNLYVNIN